MTLLERISSRRDMQAEVAADICMMFDALDRAPAEAYLAAAV
jgi:hypothetical protein